MNKSSQLPRRIKGEDDYQTPPEAIRPLIKYLNPEWIIWECAAGGGAYGRRIKKK